MNLNSRPMTWIVIPPSRWSTTRGLTAEMERTFGVDDAGAIYLPAAFVGHNVDFVLGWADLMKVEAMLCNTAMADGFHFPAEWLMRAFPYSAPAIAMVLGLLQPFVELNAATVP